jgi:uncharacterized membrane protein YqjE
VAGLRFKIFVEELRLEKMRIIRATWAVAFGFACLQVFLATILCLGMVLTEGETRIWFLGILGVISLLGAILFLFLSLRVTSAREAPFTMTTNEFRKDKECLESVLRS